MPLPIRQDDLLLRIIKDLNDIRSSLRRVVGNIPLFDISNENTPDEIQVDQDNYVPGNFDILRLSANAPHTITGFRGGTKGRFLRLFNVGLHEITLAHLSLSSDLGNRINSPTGFDIVISPNGELVLYYDFTNSQWITSYASNANRVSCKLHLSNFFTVANADFAFPPIPWDLVDVDTGGFHDPANPTYITFPQTGFYEINVLIMWDFCAAWNTGSYSQIFLRDDTGVVVASDRRTFPNGGALDICLTRTIYRTKGSKMYVRVWQSTGAALDILYLGDANAVMTEFNVTSL